MNHPRIGSAICAERASDMHRPNIWTSVAFASRDRVFLPSCEETRRNVPLFKDAGGRRIVSALETAKSLRRFSVSSRRDVGNQREYSLIPSSGVLSLSLLRFGNSPNSGNLVFPRAVKTAPCCRYLRPISLSRPRPARACINGTERHSRNRPFSLFHCFRHFWRSFVPLRDLSAAASARARVKRALALVLPSFCFSDCRVWSFADRTRKLHWSWKSIESRSSFNGCQEQSCLPSAEREARLIRMPLII